MFTNTMLEFHASIVRLFASANGLGGGTAWNLGTFVGVGVALAILVVGCAVLMHATDENSPRRPEPPTLELPRSARRRFASRDPETAAVVRVCFRSWARFGRWADDLGQTLVVLLS